MIAVLIALLAVAGLVLAYLQESVAWAWAALALAAAGGLLLMYLLVGDAFFDEDELADDDDGATDGPVPTADEADDAVDAVDVTGAVASSGPPPAVKRRWRGRQDG